MASFDIKNNQGEVVGSMTHTATANKSVDVNSFGNVTTVTERDRNTGQVKSETFIGGSPYGK